MWGQRGHVFLDSYLDVLALNYGAGIRLVDFNASESARALINDWVAERTMDRVKEALPDGAIDSGTKLVLTNTIYFKANWLHQFDPANTDPAVFHAAAGERSVEMMHMTLVARYASGTDYQAVDLPYLSPDVRVLFVLPRAGALDSVVGTLGSVFDEARSNAAPFELSLSLPRFSFESARKLKAALQALGMTAAFTNAADFSGIDGEKELHIDEIYHRTFVAMDERGTEAAAATNVVINVDGGIVVLPTAEATFDRPFIFVIYDEPTGAVLFVGQLVDPG
jgi:serpin B